MADVINEMVAQRKAMQQHMHQMMQSPHRGMRMMEGKPPAGRRGPAARPDSAADSAHQSRHPPS